MSVDKTLTIKQCLDQAQQKLPNSQDTPSKLEAEILLAFVLEKPRSFLYTWPEQTVEAAQLARFNELVERRSLGEPIAYITGTREFWGLSLKVTPDTLIPRPETERLVEIALSHIPVNEPWHVADLGTGSGAIALAIASERRNVNVDASDISESAISVARENASKLALKNVHFHVGRWFAAFNSPQFNIIISNPPYVADQDPHLTQGDLRFEPMHALSSGVDGLNDIREIIKTAKEHLLIGGWLLLEHGYDQGNAVIDLFEQSGYSEVQCFQDYGDRERATIGRLAT